MADPIKPSPNRSLNILLLTLAAGSADALGYLNLGKVFTSNMTGNIVLLGIALSEGRGVETGRSLFALLAFITGNCFGAWLCSRASQEEAARAAKTTVIGCEAILLIAYALFSALLPPIRQLTFAYPLIALLGLSMGLQAAAVYRLGTPGVTTTAITGTLTTLLNGVMKTIGFVSAKQNENQPQRFHIGLQTCVILTYCGGAAMSGVLTRDASAAAGFFPALAVLLVVLIRLKRS